jgi:PadR family transcriptional regulator PadR
MNGVPELLILRLLQQEEMYGYEIVQAIRSRTDAVIAVGEGVVYPDVGVTTPFGCQFGERE